MQDKSDMKGRKQREVEGLLSIQQSPGFEFVV